MDGFKLILERVFSSKKFIYAAVPIIANAVAAFMGFDPAAKAMLVLDAAFALLVVIQGLLDFRFGAHSDGTTAAMIPPGNPETVVAGGDVNLTGRKPAPVDFSRVRRPTDP